jgi:hypothetical protein
MSNDTGSSTQAAGIHPLEGSRKRTRGNESGDQEESTARLEETKTATPLQVWFRLFRSTGDNVVTPVGGSRKVYLTDQSDIYELAKAVKRECAEDLIGVSAGRLQVYPAGTLEPVGNGMDAADVIPTGTTSKTPLVVVAPAPQDQRSKRRSSLYTKSVLSAAANRSLREEFRKQLPDEHDKGAFVAHALFVEFVKASNRMHDVSDATLDWDAADTNWLTVQAKVLEYAEALFTSRKGCVNFDFPYKENPQSALAAELIRFSIDAFNNTADDANSRTPPLVVSHQYQVVIRHPNGEVIDQTIDIVVWLASPHLGRSVLAEIVYKPSHINDSARKAQSDMYAMNLMEAHGLPCITVDIAGGRDFATWITTATAIVPYANVCEGSTWRKSFMFQGIGIDGICGLAAGLNAALKHFPTKRDDYGTLLGPVVGQCGDCVVKAYENATYIKPNLKLVQKYIDKDAILFTTRESSVSKKIVLLQMRYIKGDWKGQKRVGIFVAIMKQLASLHEQGVVHGDVRLANMLLTETGDRGVLLDFDFCAVEGSKGYPKGLQELHSDGQRHVDVTAAIRDDRIEELPMGKEHDCFSLAHVMSLFKPIRDEYTDDWNTAIRRTENGNLKKAMKRLKNSMKRLKTDWTVELPEQWNSLD